MAEELTIGLTVTATPAAPRISLQIPKDVTSSNLRKLASEATKIPLPNLRLIFRGKIIGENETIKAVDEFKLDADCVIHCMGKPVNQATASSQAPAAGAATSTAGSSVTIQPPTSNAAAPAPSANTLQAAFATLRSSNSPPTYMTAVTTLEKILSNIIGNPMEEKYRRVKINNAAFQKRLGGLPGGDDAMKAAGFATDVDDGGEPVYIMHASAEKWPALMAAKATVEGAVREAKAAANQASAPPMMMPGAAAGGMPNFGNLPGMGAGGMGGMGGPDMQQAAAQMMQDPTALQAMLQVSNFICHLLWLLPNYAASSFFKSR